MKDIIKLHCQKESSKDEKLIVKEYLRKFNKIIQTAVRIPYCTPYCENGRKNVLEWINMSDFRMDYKFDFYHHSKAEVLKFSIENRGDYDMHLLSMRNLYFDEYPKPVGKGSTYLVSSNGNHRSIVFGCIGLPYVQAYVQKRCDNKWYFYCRDNILNSYKIIVWLKEFGLIDEIEFYKDSAFLISGKNNIAGWILPDPNLGSIENMLTDMQDRFQRIIESFEEVRESNINFPNSRFKSKLLIEYAYIKNKLIN